MSVMKLFLFLFHFIWPIYLLNFISAMNVLEMIAKSPGYVDMWICGYVGVLGLKI